LEDSQRRTVPEVLAGHAARSPDREILRVVDRDARPAGRPLSWGAFVLFQAAVAAGIAGSTLDVPALVYQGAICGALGWSAMTTNLIGVYRAMKARTSA